MKGLNALFIANPLAFMGQYPMDISGDSALGRECNDPLAVPAGVYDFDLRAGSAGEVLLELLSERTNPIQMFNVIRAPAGHKTTSKTNAITAHWLPWDPKGTAQLTLPQAGPRFFFTSALAGCRFAVGPTATPTVYHISGQINQKARQKETDNVLGTGGLQRTFSSTQHYGKSGSAFVAGYWDNATMTWCFVGQKVKPPAGVGQNFTVGTLKNMNNGVMMI